MSYHSPLGGGLALRVIFEWGGGSIISDITRNIQFLCGKNTKNATKCI